VSVSVSQKSILLTILGILVVVVFWQLRTLVLSLLLSYILMAGLRPVVFRTQRIFRIGYSGASAVVYFSSIIILITLLAAFVGPLVSQFQMFVTNLPNIAKALASYAENLSLGITTSQAQTAIVPLFEQLVGRIISLTLGSVSLFLFSVSVFVTTFYLLLEHDGAVKKEFLRLKQK
jgi:predicted PurR-regulated permease PerM